MTLRPCLDCGTPSASTRCTDCRGYDSEWERLSRRARRLQPFCSDCGTPEDLQTDHSPEAWARKAAGKSIRLKDVDVVCGPCNRARGQARPTPGGTPPAKALVGPPSLLSSYTPQGVCDARGT